MEYHIKDVTIEMLKEHNPDLFKKIQESGKADEQVKTLSDNLEAERVTNQQLSEDNDNLKTDLDETKTKLEESQKENEDLKKENDTFKAKEAQAEKEALVATKLSEAKLPDHLVTDYFKESLMKLDEEGIDKAISDRKQIAEKSKGKVEGMGDEYSTGPETKKEETEAKKKQISEQLGFE